MLTTLWKKLSRAKTLKISTTLKVQWGCRYWRTMTGRSLSDPWLLHHLWTEYVGTCSLVALCSLTSLLCVLLLTLCFWFSDSNLRLFVSRDGTTALSGIRLGNRWDARHSLFYLSLPPLLVSLSACRSLFLFSFGHFHLAVCRLWVLVIETSVVKKAEVILDAQFFNVLVGLLQHFMSLSLTAVCLRPCRVSAGRYEPVVIESH